MFVEYFLGVSVCVYCVQQDPYSSIHFSNLATSLADTDFRVRTIASWKSCSVTGRSTSSRRICLISDGERPVIFRRIDIIAASLKCINCVVYAEPHSSHHNLPRKFHLPTDICDVRSSEAGQFVRNLIGIESVRKIHILQT